MAEMEAGAMAIRAKSRRVEDAYELFQLEKRGDRVSQQTLEFYDLVSLGAGMATQGAHAVWYDARNHHLDLPWNVRLHQRRGAPPPGSHAVRRAIPGEHGRRAERGGASAKAGATGSGLRQPAYWKSATWLVPSTSVRVKTSQVPAEDFDVFQTYV
jgi:hypothetical protein